MYVEKELFTLNELYKKLDVVNYGFDESFVTEIISVKEKYNSTYHFVSNRLLKNVQIDPDKVLDYFNHQVSYEKAKQLESVSISQAICFLTIQIDSHNSQIFLPLFIV